MSIQLRALGAIVIVALVLGLALVIGPVGGQSVVRAATAHPALARGCPSTVITC